MRKLKFRIWDKLRKAFIFYGDIKEFGVELSGRGESLEFLISIYDEKEAVFQQFTGLLDKNGKEIYEGDIVKTTRDAVGYVDYCLDRGCYRLLGKLTTDIYQEDLYFYDDWIKYPKGTTGNGRTCKINSDYLEVIGNIFENKELLE